MPIKRTLSLCILAVLPFTVSTPDVMSFLPLEAAQARPDTVSALKEFPAGTLVRVRLRDRRKLTGRTAGMSQESFELRTATGSIEMIAFKDVKSFKRLNDQPKGVPRNLSALWAVTGVVAGLLTYIAIHRRR
jgi:hypothetical protein